MSETPLNAVLRAIPSLDRLLGDPSFAAIKERYAEDIVKRVTRLFLEKLRDDIRAGKASSENCSCEAIASQVRNRILARVRPTLRTVINATGVIVHTNLGRSPLSKRVVERIASVALSYSNLEYDLEKGQRGERNAHFRSLMTELTGAEAALAVNNNAAAVLLALSSLAEGREVIVSRGELIEIGGSFRIPDVMARSGAILKEVGTTNRTHPRDYVEAVNENTALILKVHTSNYRIVGFTRDVHLDELVQIGRELGIPTMMDLGSGCLVDLSPYGLNEEVTAQAVLSKGIDIISFSGDKLLGGPQAGILAGRKDLIEKMRINPLARALRIDKLTLAGLEATLEEYARAEGPAGGVPTLEMITRPLERLQGVASTLAGDIAGLVGQAAEVVIESGAGRVGGGALPMSDLPGPRVSIRPREASAARLEKALREGEPPVIALVKDDAVVLDPRTLLEDQAEMLPDLVAAAMQRIRRTHDLG